MRKGSLVWNIGELTPIGQSQLPLVGGVPLFRGEAVWME